MFGLITYISKRFLTREPFLFSPFHKNRVATEIEIYDNFNVCMEESISLEQFISPSTRSLVKSQKNAVKLNVSGHTSNVITPLDQKLKKNCGVPVLYLK